MTQFSLLQTTHFNLWAGVIFLQGVALYRVRRFGQFWQDLATALQNALFGDFSLVVDVEKVKKKV